MGHPQLSLNGYTFSELFEPRHLARLDEEFLNALESADRALYGHLIAYRHQSHNFSRDELNDLLLGVAPILSRFITHMFGVEKEVFALSSAITRQNIIFEFKEWYVTREAKRYKNEITENFADLDAWLTSQIGEPDDREWAIAVWGEALRASDILDQEKSKN